MTISYNHVTQCELPYVSMGYRTTAHENNYLCQSNTISNAFTMNFTFFFSSFFSVSNFRFYYKFDNVLKMSHILWKETQKDYWIHACPLPFELDVVNCMDLRETILSQPTSVLLIHYLKTHKSTIPKEISIGSVFMFICPSNIDQWMIWIKHVHKMVYNKSKSWDLMETIWWSKYSAEVRNFSQLYFHRKEPSRTSLTMSLKLTP